MNDDMDVQVILRLIGRGRDHAVTLGAICDATGWSTRRVYYATRAARLDGHLIGSGREGYWLADVVEFDATIRSMQRRLVEQYKTIRVMRAAANRARRFRQTTLFGEVA